MNVTQRTLAAAVVALGVHPNATSDQILSRLCKITGHDARVLLNGQVTLPDPRQDRQVAAARVLLAPKAQRSKAVVQFLTADHRLPTSERLLPPVPEDHRGVQLELIPA